MVIKWFSWEDIKSGTGPKCRQYKRTAGFFFFCLVAYLAILDVFGSDQTHFGAAQTHYGPGMDALVSIIGPKCE